MPPKTGIWGTGAADALDRIIEALLGAGESLGAFCGHFTNFVRAAVEFAVLALPCLTEDAEVKAALNEAPPRVRHLAEHGKKYRTRKKNINRALRDYRRRHRKRDKP